MKLKKISELNNIEKKIINNFILFFIIIAIVSLSLKAYEIYQEQGFSHCVEEKDGLTLEINRVCFNTSKELKEHLESGSVFYPNNLDYKYINDYTNIDVVE